ncbi:hypothetical protein HUW51_17055 [Adhaeribacter swui]|uniref:Uncharacterized protein n=1 Tax=Adhaeribacter swui TaxID=2086471 RepID=A0A7G7GB13_9BACT|nr:hypothetical protein [Adhaeribacter swui]QNF34347.1 hypothetical protein HUW51_17055 [Adhaeribacter swui]
MQAIQIRDHQTAKDWVNVENLLSLEAAKNHKVSIPKTDGRLDTFFNLANGFAIAVTVVLRNGRLQINQIRTNGDNTVTGWTFQYSGTDLIFSLRNNYGTLSSGRKGWQIPVNLSNNIIYRIVFVNVSTSSAFFLVNNKYYAAVTGGTGSFTSITPVSEGVTIGPKYDNSEYNDCLIGDLVFFSRSLTVIEAELLRLEISNIPSRFHTNCVGFWTFNHRYGRKAWDSVEMFNYAKGDRTSALALSGFTYGNKWAIEGDKAVFNINRSAIVENGHTAFVQLIGAAPKISVTDWFFTTITFTIVDSFDGDGVYLSGQNNYDRFVANSGYYKNAGTYSYTTLVQNTHNALAMFRLDFIANANNTTGSINNIVVRTWNTLTANHGELINYTDDETKIYLNGSIALIFGSAGKAASTFTGSIGDGSAQFSRVEVGFSAYRSFYLTSSANYSIIAGLSNQSGFGAYLRLTVSDTNGNVLATVNGPSTGGITVPMAKKTLDFVSPENGNIILTLAGIGSTAGTYGITDRIDIVQKNPVNYSQWVDYYQKKPVFRFDSERKDLITGLPEPVNALKMLNNKRVLISPTLNNLPSGTLMFAFYLTENPTKTEYLFGSSRIDTGTGYTDIYFDANGALLYGTNRANLASCNLKTANGVITKGFNLVTIGHQNTRAGFENAGGFKVAVNGRYIPFTLSSVINSTVYGNLVADLATAQGLGLKITGTSLGGVQAHAYSNYFTSGYFIYFGYYSNVLSQADNLKAFRNLLFNFSGFRLVSGFTMNQLNAGVINGSGTTARTLSFPDHTAAELDPLNPDYILTPINNLR